MRRTGQPTASPPAVIEVSKPSVVLEAQMNHWTGQLEASAARRKTTVQELTTLEIGIENLKESIPAAADDEAGGGEPRERSRDRKAEEAKARLLKSEEKKANLTRIIAECDSTKEKVTARLAKYRTLAEGINTLIAEGAADEELLVDSEPEGLD